MTDAARETPPPGGESVSALLDKILLATADAVELDRKARLDRRFREDAERARATLVALHARIAALRGEKPPRITVPAPREKREDNAITKKNIEQALRLKKALERAHAKIVFQHTHL